MIRSIVSHPAAIRCALVLTVTVAFTGCFDELSGSQPAAASAATPLAQQANQAPEITGVPATTIESGQTYTFAPAAIDAEQDFLEFQVTNKPAWTQFSDETGTLSGTPQDEDVGETADITIAVTDGRDHRAVGPFRITVVPRGKPATGGITPPSISGSASGSVRVGQAYSFIPTASDANNDRLTFLISNRPSWATFSTATGALTGTPTEANVGTYARIVVSVSDGKFITSLPAFTIQVNNVDNRAPSISGVPSTSLQATQTYSFVPVATDADGDSLSYSIQNKPSWATFDATNGRLKGTPGVAIAGSYANILISVSDGKATASLPAFTITVGPAPSGTPTISGSPATTATVGTAYSFRPSASDPNGDTLSYSIQNRPTWAAFNTITGALTGTPKTVGTSSNIILSTSDGKSSASLAPFAIVVKQPANDPPTISGTPPTSASVGVAYRFQPSASDPNGDTLLWSIANKPSWATFNTATGNLSGTPAEANAGAFTNITISVSDGKAKVALAPFTMTVAPNALGSARLLWQAPTQNDDASVLTDLAGFRIVYGTSPSELTKTIDVLGPNSTNYTVDSLTAGTWYFAVRAYTAAGTESALSTIASKTVP